MTISFSRMSAARSTPRTRPRTPRRRASPRADASGRNHRVQPFAASPVFLQHNPIAVVAARCAAQAAQGDFFRPDVADVFRQRIANALRGGDYDPMLLGWPAEDDEDIDRWTPVINQPIPRGGRCCEVAGAAAGARVPLCRSRPCARRRPREPRRRHPRSGAADRGADVGARHPTGRRLRRMQARLVGLR